MEIKTNEQASRAIKITLEENGQVLARAFLYLIYNDQHKEPYGYAEDIFVSPESRGAGLGNKILDALIAAAKDQGCYKLIGTTRHSKPEVQSWYERRGFKNWGVEFRIDF